MTFVNSTYSADFQVPGELSGKIPGYGGYCPRIKYNFGRTFGESTRRTLEELRERATSSSSNRSTHFSLGINPAQAPRWKSNQPYRLFNTADERDRYLTLHQRVQMQRHQYKDRSGKVYPLPDFEMTTTRQSKSSDGNRALEEQVTDTQDSAHPTSLLLVTRQGYSRCLLPEEINKHSIS